MVLTLQEMLERIRPAGTPGAPTEGELQRRHEDRAAEIADVTELLAEFEAEAMAIVAQAEIDASRCRDRAHQQARRLSASLPDRIAAARARIAADDARRSDKEVDAKGSAAEQRAARLEDEAESAIPALVDAAIEVIWNSMTPPTEQSS